MFECEVSLVYPAQVPEQPVPRKEILIKKKIRPGVVGQACNPSAVEVQTGSSQELPGL